MRVRKVNSVDVKLHDLTKVKLKTVGNTSVVQFAAGNSKTCLMWITVTYKDVMTDGKQAFLDAKLFLRKLKR